jgi:predicted nucleotidyltransferase
MRHDVNTIMRPLIIKKVLSRDERVVFGFAYGSFIGEKSFKDIDLGIYVKNSPENLFVITSDLKTCLSRSAQESALDLIADDFDVKIINGAPFTFLKRVFKEGILLVDRDPDLRTDLVEQVSLKYRECAGLLAETSLL